MNSKRSVYARAQQNKPTPTSPHQELSVFPKRACQMLFVLCDDAVRHDKCVLVWIYNAFLTVENDFENVELWPPKSVIYCLLILLPFDK